MLFDHLLDNQWYNVALQVVGLASSVAVALPKSKYSRAYNRVRGIINLFALNFGFAENKQ